MVLAARGFGMNGQALYTNVTNPKYTWLTFTVTPTNGLGVTSVKSNGYCNYVFMHTSTTPAATNGFTNPNPPSGYALINFANNFNYFLGMRAHVSAPATNTSQTSVTANSVYVITALGTATTAQWQAKGLPAGLTPTVGQTFVATASGTIGGSATVGDPGVTNVGSISVVGDPNQMIANSNLSANGGAQLVLLFAATTVSGTVSAPVFTGSALAAHSHDLLIKGGQAASTTNDVAIYSGPLLGKEQAADATVVGGSSSNGGVQTASAGTPAGTNSAPTFTDTSTRAAVAPTAGSIIRLELCYDGSSVTIDGL